jgi:solute carrier family 25 phosphate transporter 3
MGKQVSFDFFAKILYALAAHFTLAANDVKWFISIGAAFLASIMACLSSQPGDMILTATYGSHHGPVDPKAKVNATEDKSFSSVVRSIYKKHGLGGFYLGTQARLVHVASIITTQLVLYDLIKMGLGLPVTGSH